jgi:enoyl-CoA hydratase
VERLRLEVARGVATLSLDHPPVNAVDRLLLDELAAVLGAPERWPGEARVLLLTGAGRCFSAGHDRAEDGVLADPVAARSHFGAAVRALDALAQLPMPSVAAVGGPAIGVGLLLAASCTAAVFAEDALLQLPERAVGVAAGAAHVRRLLPPGLGRWLLLTGAPMEARQLRGALPVVAPEDLDATAAAVAADIASSPRAVTRLLSEQLAGGESLAEDYRRELEATVVALEDPDRPVTPRPRAPRAGPA